jgi:hypothetical protein
MKIIQDILDLVNNPQSRTKIAMALKQGEQSVAIACRQNADNGVLTKYAALEVISEETGKSIEEIIDRTSAAVPVGNMES